MREAWDILRVLWISQKMTILTTLSILGVLLVLVYELYTYREHEVRKNLMEADFERVINDPGAEERVLSIARRFDCVVCDTCRNMPLETCDCRSGKAARNYIRKEIVAHSGDSVVVLHVAQVFGGLKDQKSK
ncbi:MAG: hypothetical protein Q8P51_06915 [Ignavibacteria bacterium]|nr:hypothetical protein [Ignavibacteria bacterium]